MKRTYQPPAVEGSWRGVDNEIEQFWKSAPDVWRGGDYDPKHLRALVEHAIEYGRLLGLATKPEPAEPPAGMVRVRIAVAATADRWSAVGDDDQSDEESVRFATMRLDPEKDLARLSWVEAWVPRPEDPEVVEGEVRDGESDRELPFSDRASKDENPQ